MDRLTMIDGCGNDELVRCMSCGLEKAGADLEHCGMCEEGWQRALKKLAAYEDTGLEPEDITRPFDETTILQLAGSALGVPPDRLRELAQADREGRCVVLPCKVGDKVYVIDEGDYRSDYKPYVRKKEVTEISWKKAKNGRDLGFGLIIKGGDCNTSARYKLANIGKSIFLTWKEAKAALRETEE